ncbi:MAG: hypothetical protein AAF628_37235 [Planctomycetota bacterium]
MLKRSALIPAAVVLRPAVAVLAALAVPAQIPTWTTIRVPTLSPSALTAARDAAVAYDASNHVFFAVWTEVQRFPYYGNATVGQFLSPDGTILGTPLCMHCLGFPTEPAIANVASRGAFVLATNHGVFGLSAATGQITAQSGPISTPIALGGDASGTHNAALLVRRNYSDLEAVEIIVEPGVAGVREGRSVPLAADMTYLEQAAVTANNGPAGRHFAVWTKGGDLFGAILDRNLNVLDEGVVLRSPDTLTSPAVAGDGSRWLVAFHARSAGQVSDRCLPVHWDTNRGSAFVGTPVDIGNPGSGLRPPSVTDLGEAFLIAYNDGVHGGGTLVTVDPFTCRPCQAAVGVGHLGTVALTSQRELGAAGEVALGFAPFPQQSQAHFLATQDGQTMSLGGGCGRGGVSAATCARAGNNEFTLRLRDARPEAPTVLVLGSAAAPYPCGPCALLVDASSGATLPGGRTDPRGNAAVPVPLPALPTLVGATLALQWVTATGSSAACPLGFDFSDTLAVTIE